MDIILWIIGGLLGVINLFFWHDRKKIEQDILLIERRLEEIAKDAHQLATKQAHYTTHADVRDLIRESIDPLHATQRETMLLVKDINNNLNNLSRDLAVINALREREVAKRLGE